MKDSSTPTKTLNKRISFDAFVFPLNQVEEKAGEAGTEPDPSVTKEVERKITEIEAEGDRTPSAVASSQHHLPSAKASEQDDYTQAQSTLRTEIYSNYTRKQNNYDDIVQTKTPPHIAQPALRLTTPPVAQPEPPRNIPL